MDRRALVRFRKNRGAVAGLLLVVAIVLFSVLVPVLSRHSPFVPDFAHGRGPFGTPGRPSPEHVIGTDVIFRDLLVRVAYGGRLSLEVAFVATIISMVIGTAIGVASGFFKGTKVRLDRMGDVVGVSAAVTATLFALAGSSVTAYRFVGLSAWAFASGFLLRLIASVDALASDERRRALDGVDALDAACALALLVALLRLRGDALSRHDVAVAVVSAGALSLVGRSLLHRVERPLRRPWLDFDDVAMRAVDVLLSFPFLLLLMALSAAVDRTTEATIFLVLGLTAWTGTARVIRGKTLQIRELDFIVASRALGQSTPRVLARHVLPNVIGIAIVLATNSVAGMIVAEAALSFLGLSVPPPAASWGRMLDEGRAYYAVAPWLLLAPACAILLAVLGFNLLGEGLRDAFDPKDA